LEEKLRCTKNRHLSDNRATWPGDRHLPDDRATWWMAATCPATSAASDDVRVAPDGPVEQASPCSR